MTATAVRQQRLPLDVAALDAVETRIAERERLRGRLHAALLRDVLEHRGLHTAAGADVAVGPALALLLGSSEWHARSLVEQADVLAGLPGALPALEEGLLTVEGSRAVVDLLGPLDLGPRLRVWELLRARLERDAAAQAVLPPARLREVLRRLVVKVDAEGAEARRRQAVRDGGVEVRRRDDGLVDLLVLGISVLDGQAVLARLDQTVSPEPDDDRTVPARRRDAALDLLLGRVTPAPGSAPTGCQVAVLVPLSSALAATAPVGLGTRPGTQDGLAELVGHGSLLPSETAAVLASAPVLQPVWVDADGLPVAVSAQTLRPGAGAAAAHEALLEVAHLPAPEHRHPRHPDDHPPGGRPPDDAATSHTPSTPGRYRPPADLARLLRLRSQRCEWPACGARSGRCDLDHDVAHPVGPTCACNVGPLCRRHHQVKQRGWTKTRTADGGVRWTSPTGRVRTSPPQHRDECAGLPHTDADLEQLLDEIEERDADG